MNSKKTKNLFVGAMLFAPILTGCTTKPHSTEAFLLNEKTTGEFSLASSKKMDKLTYGNNPIYVKSGSKFTINLTEISPGFIHPNSQWSAPSVDSEEWSKKVSSHFRGKELWLLASIKEINKNDIFETKSKTVFHATNVKFDSESYRLLPLDKDEILVFTGESNSPYRVSIKLMEVDNFKLKVALADVYGNTPGIVGLAKGLTNTVTGIMGDIVGKAVMTSAKKKFGEEGLFERILMQAGANIELQGDFLILRKDEKIQPVPIPKATDKKGVTKKSILITKNYLLYDFFKSSAYGESGFSGECKAVEPIKEYLMVKGVNQRQDMGFVDRPTYRNTQRCAKNNLTINDDQLNEGEGRHAYFRIVVNQTPSPVVARKKVLEGELAQLEKIKSSQSENVQFLQDTLEKIKSKNIKIKSNY
jgi:hypothetical protein